jgi:hypothetical protein
MNSQSLVVLFSLMFACSCGTSSSDDMPLPPSPDASDDRDGSRTDSAPEASQDVLADALDGPPASDRQLVQRTWHPTSVTNVLMDPFVTGDTAWGHFSSLFLAPNDTSKDIWIALPRSLSGSTPVGSAKPILRLSELKAQAGSSKKLWILAPFLGAKSAYRASIWASAGDATEHPVPFDSSTEKLTVAILDPSGNSGTYFDPDLSSKKVVGGREWVRMSLPDPVAFPHGGWFIVQVSDLASSWLLAAPEVTPDDPAAPPSPPRPPRVRVAHGTAEDRAAIRAYGEFMLRR